MISNYVYLWVVHVLKIFKKPPIIDLSWIRAWPQRRKTTKKVLILSIPPGHCLLCDDIRRDSTIVHDDACRLVLKLVSSRAYRQYRKNSTTVDKHWSVVVQSRSIRRNWPSRQRVNIGNSARPRPTFFSTLTLPSNIQWIVTIALASVLPSC